VPTNSISNITLAVLAGGAGSRMGMPKGQLCIGNQPILEYLLDRLNWPGPTMLVTAPGREHPPGATRFDREASDPVEGLGPLRGVLTALENATTSRLFVLTVDMPGIGRTQLEHFLRSADEAELGAMYERKAPDSVIEPFPLLVRCEAQSVVRRRINAGQLSVARLRDEPGFTTVQASGEWDDRVWTNLNRPADLERFRPLAPGQSP
jgi:molybdopterin-guanine dinucleotide biosynthesis protein A